LSDDRQILAYSSARRTTDRRTPRIAKFGFAAFALFVVSICSSVAGIRCAQRIEGSEVLVGSPHDDAYELLFVGIPLLATLLLFVLILLSFFSLLRKNVPDWNWHALILISVFSFCAFVGWLGWVDNPFP
jgi:hypothetical protein